MAVQPLYLVWKIYHIPIHDTDSWRYRRHISALFLTVTNNSDTYILNMKVQCTVVPVHIGEAEVQLHPFPSSAPDGELSTSPPSRLTPKEKQAPMNRLRGPRSQSGRFWRKENISPLPEFEPRTVQP